MKLPHVLTALFTILPVLAFASFGDQSPGVGLSARFMCDTFTVMSGPIGLFIGFAIALYGLYQIIVSASVGKGLMFIIVGALLTALPGVVRTGITGTSEFLKAADISTGTVTDQMNYALGYQGRCQDIPVDWKDYDETQASYYQSPGNDPITGKPLPSPAQSGRPAVISSTPSGVFTKPRNNAPDGDYSQSGKNVCPDLVEGGSVLSSPWGFQAKRGRVHHGIDLAGSCRGKPIKPSSGGRISFSGHIGGYGNRIEIDHGGDKKTTYSHMSQLLKKTGDSVGTEQIGYCGDTGIGSGPHLHFEVIVGGNSQNPLPGCGK